MSAPSFDEYETSFDKLIDSDENPTSLTTKGQRRRRIEELEDHKRLLKEIEEDF
ncbi:MULTISPECIES: PA3496 family putative envelope integrity protein [Legionella]|uniref:PA3496 family putative envelope integrity protein n=1 Tax=Legionella TaxID=445 RepID=UPI0013152A74|nr:MULTISPECIES: hypothetical protein [Legionella]MCP0914196.1 hypothetical protein [Legionella sp. 27cVA30]